MYDLDAYHAGVWGQLAFVGLIALAVGMIVLAVATKRSGTYPRWASWVLVANIVVSSVTSFVAPLGAALRTPAPSYLLMALSGLAMIRLAQQRGTTDTYGARRVGMPDAATSDAL